MLFFFIAAPERLDEPFGRSMTGSFAALSCAMGCFSQCSTTLLAITRFMKIINPFRRIRKSILKVYLAAYTCFMIVEGITGAIIFHELAYSDNYKTKRLTEISYKILMIVCVVLNILHCFLGVIFSMITVVYVHCIQAVSQTNLTRRVCGTILLMNIVYIGTLIGFFLRVSGYDRGLILFNVVYVLMPILTSAWNPIVLFTRVQAVRQTSVLLLRSIFNVRCRNPLPDIENVQENDGQDQQGHIMAFQNETEL